MRLPIAAALPLLLAGAFACTRAAPLAPLRAPAPPLAARVTPAAPSPAASSAPAPASPAAPLIAAARLRLTAATASPTHDHAQLELSRALASQAIDADPQSPEAHLVLALVDRELSDYARALASFDRARALDPGLFEAHASAAALRLRFRDFPAAAAAYRDAIRARPSDYDAHLGLAIALRGAIDAGDDADDAGWNTRFEAAQKAIDATIALAPDRPEAYLSAGALAMDHGTRRPRPESEQALLRAKIALAKFLTLAGSSPALAGQRALAEARLQVIRDITECDFRTPESVRKEREMELRVKEAEEALKSE